ncbi:hypothetical protein BDW60DRAFT_202765 [Aspergillus nidulans var. acristatus]
MGEASSTDITPTTAPRPTNLRVKSSLRQGASQRRLIQKARFDALLANRAVTCDEKVEVADESQISTAQLIFPKASSKARWILERAGKTLIAVLLLKYTIEKELNNRTNGEPHQISFFLVDSVTLSYQQAGVLRSNLDINVGHIYGALGPDLWSRQTWTEFLEKYMVVVGTAEILYQCLLHAHIRMEQINLLVFDEAHNTKKDHVYARSVKRN